MNTDCGGARASRPQQLRFENISRTVRSILVRCGRCARDGCAPVEQISRIDAKRTTRTEWHLTLIFGRWGFLSSTLNSQLSTITDFHPVCPKRNACSLAFQNRRRPFFKSIRPALR